MLLRLCSQHYFILVMNPVTKIIIITIIIIITDLNAIDTKTQNLMRKFHIVHNKVNVERLYLPRNEGGNGFISLWNHYQKSTIIVVHYLYRNNDSRLFYF